MVPQLPEKVAQLQKVLDLLPCSGPSTEIWLQHYRIPVVANYFLKLLEKCKSMKVKNSF